MEINRLDTREPPGEDPAMVQEKLEEIRRLITEQPDLKIWSDEDWYLLRFLRYRNFNPAYALRQLKSYEKFKAEQGPSWLEIPRTHFTDILNSRVAQVLIDRHPDGARILWLQVGIWQPSEVPAETLLQICGVLGEIGELEPISQGTGVYAILDMANLGFTQFRGLSPSFAGKMVSYLATAFPMRLNGIHIVHQPALFSMVFSLFKGFLDERMRRRLFFHGHDLESLHEHIPANVLPPELGGDNPQPEDPHWWQCTVFGDAVTSGLKKQGIVFVNNPA
ncbi:alpha-tocopherol transfer protein isoform X1 [Anabrus simplex]|uniref:alpha-tocopherol transfer protein isoform X1 n=1 Tax=Anabrus simplex TaxID=316456 RepID=UPI0034DD0BB7